MLQERVLVRNYKVNFAAAVSLILLTGLLIIRTGCILEETARRELERTDRMIEYQRHINAEVFFGMGGDPKGGTHE